MRHLATLGVRDEGLGASPAHNEKRTADPLRNERGGRVQFKMNNYGQFTMAEAGLQGAVKYMMDLKDVGKSYKQYLILFSIFNVINNRICRAF